MRGKFHEFNVTHFNEEIKRRKKNAFNPECEWCGSSLNFFVKISLIFEIKFETKTM